MSALREAAQSLERMRAAFFPLQPGLKVPLPGSRGFLDAASNAAAWDVDPQYNIGFVPASLGLIAIDLDKPQHWDEARALGLLAEPTFEVTTPNGVHLYFRGRAPENGCPVGSLVVRGRYGYTVFPPSVSSDGSMYRTDGTIADAKPVPPELAAQLARADGRGGARDRVTQVFSGRRIDEGGRHPALCTLAGHLAGRGVDEAHGVELVHAWNAQFCDPPKDSREVSKLVADVYAKEREKRTGIAAAFTVTDPFARTIATHGRTVTSRRSAIHRGRR